MYSVLVLSVLITLSAARPEVGLESSYKPLPSGYHYGQPTNHFNTHGFGTSGTLPTPSFLAAATQEANSYAASGHTTHTTNSQYNKHIEQPLINKYFYIHAAPEDHSHSGEVQHLTIGRPQKNYRVVFIKAPAHNNAHLSAEYPPNEDKTVIYVLTQKGHEIDTNDIATPAPTKPSKPEVFFVKYKTKEEADHAQHQIQAQYNALGGTSQVSYETSPITSVVGSLGTKQSVNNQYLPSH